MLKYRKIAIAKNQALRKEQSVVQSFLSIESSEIVQSEKLGTEADEEMPNISSKLFNGVLVSKNS